MGPLQLLVIVFVALGCAGQPAAGARTLAGDSKGSPGDRDWSDPNREIGDPSGYLTWGNARLFQGRGSKVRTALTPEQAESATSSDWKAIFRFQPHPGAVVPFATVESDPYRINPDRRKEAVKTWARVAIDSPERRTRVDIAGGAAQVPALAMGTAAGSQTYMGATAISASDSVEVGGWHQKPTVAKSMITSFPRPLRRAGGASIGLTAQTAKTVSVSGAADGVIALAQAHEVAAMSQAERSSADQWHNP